MNDINVFLPEEDLPESFYNIVPDLPTPLPPPLDPITKKPLDPKQLRAIFPAEIIKQEISDRRYVRIDEELRDLYIAIGRPRPLKRAYRLERYLKLPGNIRIYYKREDLSPTGSHKPNTALAQAYYAKKEGYEVLTTETGAGQWGSALAMACSFNGMKAVIFMVKVSYEQKPLRKTLMRLFGAEVHPSPSNITKFGRKIIQKNPNEYGSLGIAISEAIELALDNEKYAYSLGSVLNHVLMHQTIIGLEAMKQFEFMGSMPDTVVGCIGGGSNFAGISFPFIRERLKGKINTEFIAVEPTEVPTLTKGKYMYDFGDSARLTPLLKMYSLGHEFRPPPIYAGGLRYHGDAPIVSLLKHEGIVRAEAYDQDDSFRAAEIFAKTEGVVIAPETSHAVAAVIDIARKAKKMKEEKIILFNLSGHGLLDLQGYEDILKL